MAGVDPDLKSGDPVVNPAKAGPTELHLINSKTIRDHINYIFESELVDLLVNRASILFLLFHRLISPSRSIAAERFGNSDS
jgi:hypothetical protein